MIKLVIEPGPGKSWERFLKENPPYSIAIDGYVNASVKLNPKGPHLNLDHHVGVDRLSTYSTCRQMFLCLNGRVFSSFHKEGGPHAIVYGNDCDQDVCLTYWQLENHERFTGARSEPRLMKLLDVVDLLDSTGGLYLVDINSRIRREVNWIFRPYTEARTTGKLNKMSGEEMVALVKTVGGRIKDYANGRGEQIESDMRYEMLHKGKGWIMFREIGADARCKACMDHEVAYVMLKEGDNDGRYHYSIGRLSQFIPFPVKEIMDALNAAEGPTVIEEKYRPTWGGSDIIGGSPRVFGSCLKPEEVIKIVEEVLARMHTN